MKNSLPIQRAMLVILAVFATVSQAGAAPPSGDWPCIQPLVEEMTVGQMWAGPPIEENAAWRDDKAVAEAVGILAPRRTPLEEAAARIEKFAAAAGAEKNAKLTLLFAGIFERLNKERSRVVAGIKRYALKQRALSERIKKTGETLDQHKAGITPKPEAPDEATLKETLRWDTRIYEERNKSLTYVCETPRIIAQRAYSLAREIQNHLD